MAVHHGRYNEPGTAGKDIYGLNEKIQKHINQVKTRQRMAQTKPEQGRAQ